MDQPSPWATYSTAWVWDILAEAGEPLTLRQISGRLGWFTRTVTPLLSILREAGFAAERDGRWSATADLVESLEIYYGVRSE